MRPIIQTQACRQLLGDGIVVGDDRCELSDISSNPSLNFGFSWSENNGNSRNYVTFKMSMNSCKLLF